MKKLLVLAAAGLFVAASMSRAAEVDGKKVYGAKCAMCHGVDAKGKAAMAKASKVELSAMDLTTPAVGAKGQADLVKIVTDGTGKMKGFKGKLSPAEIEGVAKYVKSLGTAAPAKDKK